MKAALWLVAAAALVFGSVYQLPAAIPSDVLTDTNGIEGFELHGLGLYSWDAPGRCSGEFPNEATIRVRAAGVFSATKSLAQNCDILENVNANVVRDGLFVYFFANRQLHRKALSASEGDPAGPMPAAGLLPSAQEAAYLELANGFLYWAEFNAGLSGMFIRRMPTDQSVAAQTVATISFGGAEVRKMKYFTYRDSADKTVEALAVLLANGRLYRVTLDPVRALLLASGINDFAVHTIVPIIAELFVTSIYAAKGVEQPGPSSAPGSLLRIDANSGASSVLYTAQGRNQVVAVGTDSAYGFPFAIKNIYFAESVVSCGELGFCVINDYAIRRNAAPGTSGSWDLIVNSGGGVNLRSDDDWLYFIEGKKRIRIRRISSGAPAIQFDIQALGLEIGQTIQDMNMTVPLVARRSTPTYARGYATAATNTTGLPSFFPHAELRVFAAGKEIEGSPFSPVNNTQIDGTSNMATLRPALNRSFLFELPGLPAGTLTATMTVNPNGTIVETGTNPFANNTVTVAVTVQESIDVCLRMFALATGAGTYNPNTPGFMDILNRAASLLPCQGLTAITSAGALGDEVFFTQPFGGVNSNDTQDDEALEEIDCLVTQSSGATLCKFTHWVGMIHPGVANFGGLGYTPGRALIASMRGAGGGFPNPDSPLGGRTLAHEMSHNYGRLHVNCGGPANPDPNYPFPSCQIGPNNATAFWGFDLLSSTVIGPTNAGDVMSYAASRWMSSYTWNGDLAAYKILQFLPLSAHSAPVRLQAAAQAGQVLFVNGHVRTDLNTAQFRSFHLLPADAVDRGNLNEALATSERLGRDPTAYFFRFLDAAGNVLGQTAVPLKQPTDGPVLRLSFVHWIPYLPGARRIQLVHQDAVLAERVVSPRAPVLQLGQPLIDAAAQTIGLSWTASDPDGDPLLFNVHYSADNGVNWDALRVHSAGLSVSLDLRQLRGSTQARLRATATDGVNTVVAITEPFAVPKKAPTPLIGGVQDGQRFEFGQRLVLRGLALGPEETSGAIQLNWNLSGPLSSTNVGETLSLGSPPPGAYQVTLTARDSQGLSAATTRNFEVLPIRIPDGPAPKLDGLCNDAAYANAAFICVPLGNGAVAPVRLVHGEGHLYVCFSELQPPTRGLRKIGLRVDVDASRSPLAQADDIGFFVDSEGIPSQEVGTSRGMAETLSPRPGFTAVVRRGTNAWSAEFRIAESLVGGWNHGAGIMIDHDAVGWPAMAVDGAPATWAAAYLGTSLPAEPNRLPVADAGPRQIINASAPRLVVLDGSGSRDPDGNPLSYRWTQVSGPTVALTNTTAANPSFIAQPSSEVLQLRFQLVVSDGSGTSAPAETEVHLMPTAKLDQAQAPRAVAHEGAFYARFRGEPGATYELQASRDLVHWELLSRNTADSLGIVQFIEADITKHPHRFYRAVKP